MSKTPRSIPELPAPDRSLWQGRVDAAEGERALRWHQVIQPEGPEAAPGLALLGFASDAGVRRNQGRPGAVAGPDALRRMLANLPAQPGLHLLEAGTITVETEDLEAGQAAFGARIADLLDRGHRPIGLGGGHEIAFGTFQGLERHLSQREAAPRLGILNLDAHFDLRSGPQGTSGTPFRQIAEGCRERGWPFRYLALGISAFANTEALFQAAREVGAAWRLDEAMGFADLPEIQREVTGWLEGLDHLHLSICLDVLPAADAPGVSAPSARGVALEVVEKVLDLAAASGKLRVVEVAELNPSLDEGQRTARVAARLVGRLAARWEATRA